MKRLLQVNMSKFSRMRIISICSFFLLCVIDQRIKTGTGLDGWIETFRNLTGVALALLIIGHYKWKDFVAYKVPYGVWTALGVVGGAMALVLGKNNRPFLNEWIVLVIDVVLYGYIVIHTIISISVEKKCPKFNKKWGIIWSLMMVLMIISRSTYIWPLCYLVMFGCLYLTDYTNEEREDMFQGMQDGIILAFFAFQAFCCVFRPYDLIRYQGIYHNPNLNAFFYLVVLAAVLSKILYVTKKNAAKWIRVYYWLGAGAVLALLFMSLGRAAWLVAFVMGIVFLLGMRKVQGKNNFLKNGIVLVLCACLLFPVCFGLVRYIPPQFHHPVWFWGEWAETRVHSWDPWDSEKYIDLDEFMDVAVWRIWDSFTDIAKESPLLLKAEASTAEEIIAQMSAEELSELEYRESVRDNSFIIRKIIYQHYLERLNLWGHTPEEQGFLFYEGFYVGHAHNIFLQFGTDFGIPVMLLLITIVVVGLIKLWKGFVASTQIKDISYLLFLIVPIGFGMLEYSWGVGSIGTLLLFITIGKVIWDEAE